MYATIFGLLYAIFYLLARRNLWPVIVVHALRDCLAFWSVYSS
jgi:membrane protease YdiL (CAAX protease family)